MAKSCLSLLWQVSRSRTTDQESDYRLDDICDRTVADLFANAARRRVYAPNESGDEERIVDSLEISQEIFDLSVGISMRLQLWL